MLFNRCSLFTLTNKPSYFQHTNIFFVYYLPQKLKWFPKKATKIIAYHDYEQIPNAKFFDDVNSFVFDRFDVNIFMKWDIHYIQ